MRKWLKEISSKFNIKTDDGINPISKIDAEIVELIIDVLNGKGEIVSDLSSALELYKKATDETVKIELGRIISEIEEGNDLLYYIKAGGVSMPLKQVKTIKECSEYCYDSSRTKFYILINESEASSPTAFDNIRIHCSSEMQMYSMIRDIENYMSKFKIKFVTV